MDAPNVQRPSPSEKSFNFSILKEKDVSMEEGKKLAMVGRSIKLLTDKEIKAFSKDKRQVTTNLDVIAKAILESKINFTNFTSTEALNFWGNMAYIEDKAPTIFKKFMQGRKVVDENKKEMFSKWKQIEKEAHTVFSTKNKIARKELEEKLKQIKNELKENKIDINKLTISDLQESKELRNIVIDYLDKNLKEMNVSNMALMRTLIKLNASEQENLLEVWEEQKNMLEKELKDRMELDKPF